LFLSLLVPSREIAQLIEDPGRLIRERQGELRFLEQLAQGLLQPRSDTRPVAPAAVGKVPSPEPSGNAVPIPLRTSLLR
jgi:hypothetical protein